eukprot:scaffold105606_cov51-Prasinocladus_malaysianus.AAC.1
MRSLQETELYAKRLNAMSFRIIHPHKSPYLRKWDGVLMLLIGITIVIQPYEVAFTLPGPFDYLN